MAGHSKWANIKHRKGAQDKKRSKIFSRIVKEIFVAVREKGGDPETNPKLRLAIQNAKGANMPKDNVDRAIKKASGEGENLIEVTFEGYAPHGIAVFVECLTDNNQRSVSEVRSVFNKKGGSLGKNGSLSFLFDRKGIFTVNKSDKNIEELELELIDAGLEELEEIGDNYIFTTALEDFGNMQSKLDELNIEIVNAELQRIPNNTETLGNEESKKVLNIIEEFEELEDVQNVYHNLEITDELMEEINE